MGWWSFYKGYRLDPAEIREHILQEDFGNSEVLDIGGAGKAYYLAVKAPDGRIFGAVVLVSQRNGYVATKVMDESMHPYYYDCPKRILNLLSPTDNKNALDWRNKCWERFNKPSAKVGDVFRLKEKIRFAGGFEEDTFEVVKYGNRTLYKAVTSGSLCRIPNLAKREYTIL